MTSEEVGLPVAAPESVLDNLGTDANLTPDQALCRDLSGLRFKTPEARSCGLPGPAVCRWRIDFLDGQFEYIVSDIMYQGTYRCRDGVIMGSETNPYTNQTREFEGTFTPATGELIWEGNLYEVDSVITSLLSY